jgi:hypothetical protein
MGKVNLTAAVTAWGCWAALAIFEAAMLVLAVVLRALA